MVVCHECNFARVTEMRNRIHRMYLTELMCSTHEIKFRVQQKNILFKEMRKYISFDLRLPSILHPLIPGILFVECGSEDTSGAEWTLIWWTLICALRSGRGSDFHSPLQGQTSETTHHSLSAHTDSSPLRFSLARKSLVQPDMVIITGLVN